MNEQENNVNLLDEIKNSYLKKQSEVEKVRDKIRERKRQIIRLERKEERRIKESWWGDTMIRPILEAVKIKFPQLKWDDVRLIPMGLCCRVSVFSKFEGKTLMLSFTPSNLKEGIIAYDTGETKGNYAQGSIASLNGFEKVSEDITSIEQIFNHVQKQLDK